MLLSDKTGGCRRVEDDGGGLAPESIALYLEDREERVLFRVTTEALDSKDCKEGAGSYVITFFLSFFLSDFNCTNRHLRLSL